MYRGRILVDEFQGTLVLRLAKTPSQLVRGGTKYRDVEETPLDCFGRKTLSSYVPAQWYYTLGRNVDVCFGLWRAK